MFVLEPAQPVPLAPPAPPVLLQALVSPTLRTLVRALGRRLLVLERLATQDVLQG